MKQMLYREINGHIYLFSETLANEEIIIVSADHI